MDERFIWFMVPPDILSPNLQSGKKAKAHRHLPALQENMNTDGKKGQGSSVIFDGFFPS